MTTEITVRGASTHNLRGVDLTIAKGQLTVFAGVSGSGKTSMGVHTIHAEGQRRMLSALGIPAHRRSVPRVQSIAGLPPSVCVAARPPLVDGQLLGTLTGVSPLLAGLSAIEGVVHCPDCGRTHRHSSADEIVGALNSLPDGERVTLLAPLNIAEYAGLGALLRELRLSGFARVRIDGAMRRIDEYAPSAPVQRIELVVDRLKVRPGQSDRLMESVAGALQAGHGRLLALCGTRATPDAFGDHPWCPTSGRSWPRPAPALLDPQTSACRCAERMENHCPKCGARDLGPIARDLQLDGLPIVDWYALPAAELHERLEGLGASDRGGAIIAELRTIVAKLGSLGLGHLALQRPVATLSSSERMRAHLSSRTSSGMSGLLYVLDEPCSHVADAAHIVDHVLQLRDAGNTVIVIDHHPHVLGVADRIIEFGPAAGTGGGAIIADASPEVLRGMSTATGRALAGSIASPTPLAHTGTEGVGCLQGRFFAPWRALTVVTGPPGSGKSTLLRSVLHEAKAHVNGDQSSVAGALSRVIHLEPSPSGRSPRSCVGTLTGLWGILRSLLAATRESRLRGLGPEHFSFNTPDGRCGTCEGYGRLRAHGTAFSTLSSQCPDCNGERIGPRARDIRWRGVRAGNLLQMTVDEIAPIVAAHPKAHSIVHALQTVGVSYLTIGQDSNSVSTGEHQRLQLALVLARAMSLGPDVHEGTLVIVDGPDRGLHPADVPTVVRALQGVAQAGAAVVVSAHSPLVVGAANHEVATLGGR